MNCYNIYGCSVLTYIEFLFLNLQTGTLALRKEAHVATMRSPTTASMELAALSLRQLLTRSKGKQPTKLELFVF